MFIAWTSQQEKWRKLQKSLKHVDAGNGGIPCLELPLQTDRNHLGDIVLPAKVDVVVA